jgi:hypothetical protein
MSMQVFCTFLLRKSVPARIETSQTNTARQWRGVAPAPLEPPCPKRMKYLSAGTHEQQEQQEQQKQQ